MSKSVKRICKYCLHMCEFDNIAPYHYHCCPSVSFIPDEQLEKYFKGKSKKVKLLGFCIDFKAFSELYKDVTDGK